MILNVSSRTDIIAFYEKWLIKRVEAGFVDVRNPFNPNASELFDKLLQTSIEPFKSRGILCGEFNSAV